MDPSARRQLALNYKGTHKASSVFSPHLNALITLCYNSIRFGDSYLRPPHPRANKCHPNIPPHPLSPSGATKPLGTIVERGQPSCKKVGGVLNSSGESLRFYPPNLSSVTSSLAGNTCYRLGQSVSFTIQNTSFIPSKM